jgi:hypothetical protein
MEQSKAMEYESRKASSNVLNPCNMYKYRIITLVDFQLDIQNSYLFTYNTFFEIPCFVLSITLLIFRSSIS